MKPSNPIKWRKVLPMVGYHALAIFVTFLFSVMFLWLISSSLRQPGLAPSPSIEWIPSPITWSNYEAVFDLIPMKTFIQNSLIVVLIAVPVSIIISSWAGFALAQIEGAWRDRLVVLSILFLMIPTTALWLPRTLLYKELGIIDTVWSLVITAFMGANPLFILLFFWSFRRIPTEIFESARLDGASPLAIWATIGLPLVKPAIITVGVLAFILYWGDFVTPQLYIKSEDKYTMTVGLRTLQLLDRTNWPILMAASVMMTAPVVALFLIVQRHIWPEGYLGGMAGR